MNKHLNFDTYISFPLYLQWKKSCQQPLLVIKTTNPVRTLGIPSYIHVFYLIKNPIAPFLVKLCTPYFSWYTRSQYMYIFISVIIFVLFKYKIQHICYSVFCSLFSWVAFILVSACLLPSILFEAQEWSTGVHFSLLLLQRGSVFKALEVTLNSKPTWTLGFLFENGSVRWSHWGVMCDGLL